MNEQRPPTSDGPESVDGLVPADDSPLEMRRRSLKAAARVRRWVKRAWRAVSGMTLLLIAGVVLIAQTARGHTIALDAAMSRAERQFSGEIRVDAVRSGTLLTGGTIAGVSLDAADGRPFLSADSVQFRYSLINAVFGGPPVRSVVIWGLDLEISRYSDEQPMNVTQLLAPSAGARPASGPSRPFELGRVGVREGRVRILLPSEDGRGPVTTGPNGETLRVMALEELDLDFEEAVLSPDDEVQFSARLASLSSDITVLEEPLRVEEVFGRLAFGAQGIAVTQGAYRTEGSLLRGEVLVGPETEGGAWTFRSQLRTEGWARLEDVQWVDERIPEGVFRGAVGLRAENGLSVDLRNIEIELEASSLILDGPVRFDPEMSLDRVQVRANPLPLERLEPWLERELPLDGWLSGEAEFSGTFADLTANGQVTFVPRGLGGRPSNADFGGTLHMGESPGAADFRATIDPFNYEVLTALSPGLPWAGTGSVILAMDGRVDDGLYVDASFDHLSEESLSSSADITGVVFAGADSTGLVTDLDVQLRPLAVGALASLAPRLGLQGIVSGPVDVAGPLTDLQLRADLNVETGTARVTGRFDATRIEEGYLVTAEGDAVPLDALSTAVPERSTWTGSLEVEGRGVTLDALAVQAQMTAVRSEVAAMRVDAIDADLRIESGVLIADSLSGVVGGIEVDAAGRLGLGDGTFGSSRIDFRGESLVGLRPLLMGLSDTLLVRDSISSLQADLLRLSGIEPDTLPSAADVRLEGAVSGSASVSGRLADLDLGVLVDIHGGAYRANQVDSAKVLFTATDLPATSGDWQLGVSAHGIRWEGRSFDQGGFEVDMFDQAGVGRVEVVRRPGESYRAVGDFALDSIGGFSAGGVVDLADASIRVDEDLWVLQRPARVAWSPRRVEIDSVSIGRAGDDPMSLFADGELVRGGGSDFSLTIEGLHAEQVLRVAQIEDIDLGGRLDLDVGIRGASEAPRVEANFRVDGGRFETMQLSRLEGSMEYRDRLADFQVDGWDGARVAVSASGEYPVDLALARVENRIVEAPMDMRIEADSLDAAIALSYVTSLEGVLGSVSGEVWFSGTPSQVRPEGRLSLADGEWSIEAIGVRHTEVSGDLRLNPDRTVDVSLTSTGSGRSDVTGIVTLAPFSDPRLNLRFELDGFQAVARPDMDAILSGQFDLTGVYSRPVAQGEIVVDEGTIFVDELQRAAGIVDLSEESFLFDVGVGVDTTALVFQPLVAGFRNPFFDNLRVDVEMSVPRGSWLRSLESDIELAGELRVLYDRFFGDFVLLGDLEAVRGSHLVMGRSFDLDGGTVSFQGRPGLNPDLDIQASSRIRRPDDPPFQIDAAVTGSLLQPVVTLTTEESGLAEEDLVSYLLFGQPSSALGGRNAEGLAQVRNSNALSSVQDFAVTYVGGALFNQLGSTIARETGVVDYVSVQQSSLQTLGSRDYLRDTQVELGRYFGDDTFMVVVIRPPDGGSQDQDPIGGVRVEYALTEDYNVEGFFEDRFLRSGTQFFGASSGLLESERILGVFFFREWGFTPGRESTTDQENRNRGNR